MEVEWPVSRADLPLQGHASGSNGKAPTLVGASRFSGEPREDIRARVGQHNASAEPRMMFWKRSTSALEAGTGAALLGRWPMYGPSAGCR